MEKYGIPSSLLSSFRRGFVIPAMPLALNKDRKFNELRQRALLRYYIDAGAGGVAVGVHSTQFEIREPGIDLFKPVLSFAARAIDEFASKRGKQIFKVAGVCGKTDQAIAEASFVRDNGYHAALLSLSAFRNDSVEAMLDHCRAISEVLPLIGFYLQPSVGGRALPFDFWLRFASIPNVIAIKIAPFNRYQTFDVVRAVAEAGREKDIILYTGNDDNIVVDLLTEYSIATSGGNKKIRIMGGLLGHWSVWTRKAVLLMEEIRGIRERNEPVPVELLTRAAAVTDTNAAFFDVKNGFAGCIAGLHEVLRRQGIFEGTWCLNPNEGLSPGQKEEIDRIYESYPELNDDAFVSEHIHEWLPAGK